MCDLTVRLFGNFQVKRDDQVVNGWNARKAQELFAYLLLYRERPHPRQVLAEFSPDLPVLIAVPDKLISVQTVAELLPRAFGPSDLPDVM